MIIILGNGTCRLSLALGTGKQYRNNYVKGDRTFTLFKALRRKFPRSKTILLGWMTSDFYQKNKIIFLSRSSS